MSGRSGYTGEGGDSIMSWPRDDASSFTNDRIVHTYYAYPDYLLYDDKSAEWDAERLALKDSQHMLQLELAAQDQILSELELQLLAEKKMTKQIKTEKIKLEMDLAYEDHVIEELDLKFEEEKKMTKQLKAEKIKLEMDLAYHDQVIEELEVKIEQEKKMNADNIKDMRIQLEEKSAFALAATCVAITLFVVLVAIYAKL